MTRPARLATLLAAALLLTGCGAAAAEEDRSNVLTIGMTAAEIPNPDTVLSGGQGYEGYRFVGNSLYDGLTRYDLTTSDRTPQVVPALAETWQADATGSVWTFTLRQGVRFSDGTPFDAAAVAFNLDRYLNEAAPQFYPAAAAQAGIALGSVARYTAVDARTVRIETAAPNAHLAADLVFVYMASPTAVTRLGNEGFGRQPTGTGPFVFESLARGQELRMRRNPDYWRGPPLLDELVLRPLPDASARLAALQAGEVDWIEAPNPDDLPMLVAGGFQVLTNSYDHVWPWVLDTTDGPLRDVRVRRALNYAIDREAMATHLLSGTADPARQLVAQAGVAYRPDNDVFGYDPGRARALLAEAGYPDGFPMTVAYPTSGSGNMQPGPMNELLQSDLADVGVRVQLVPIEWATLLTSYSAGEIPVGADAVNISLTFIQETFWSLSFRSDSPLNVGRFADPRVDALLTAAQAETDDTARFARYAEVARIVDEQAVWLVVVNDRNPRALAPTVHGFVQPRSWFVDLTTVSVSDPG